MEPIVLGYFFKALWNVKFFTAKHCGFYFECCLVSVLGFFTVFIKLIVNHCDFYLRCCVQNVMEYNVIGFMIFDLILVW